MKNLCLWGVLVLVANTLSAQAPSMVNYQAVARNSATGNAIADQEIYLLASVRASGPQGNIVYQEEHPSVVTNAFGLFSIHLGGGQVISGDFAEIPWGQNTYWLDVQIDIGSGLEPLGAMQFVSVPYALHAQTVTDADDADADPTNELISSAEFDPESLDISIFEGPNNQVTLNLSDLNVDDGDADPSNELINSAVYDPNNNHILIGEGVDNNIAIDMSNFSVDDADSDPGNELINSAIYDSNSGNILINEGNGNITAVDMSGFSVDDADSDPTNELISSVGLVGNDLKIVEATAYTTSLSRFRVDSIRLAPSSNLELYEGGTAYTADLSPLAGDEDWQVDPEQDIVYNLDDRVGVGTSEISSKMAIKGGGGQTALSVRSSTDAILLHVGPTRVGVRTANPKSSLEVNGSFAIGVKLLVASDSPYTVTDTDNTLVWKLEDEVGLSDVSMLMPDPASCPGRIITVRKTGPDPGAANVDILFGGAQLDYSNTSQSLSGGQPKTIVFLSLGADGWTELISP